jgi:hypothetical protein
MLLEEADVDVAGEGVDELEAELKDTELDALDDATEPSATPSFTSRPVVHTSALTATASLSAATPVATSASMRGACTSTARQEGDITAR